MTQVVDAPDLEQRSARPAPARVLREPMTYRRGALDDNGRGISYVRDLALCHAHPESLARLNRHALESDNYRKELRSRTVATELEDGSPIEYRVNPSDIAGQGGYFAPPKWLIDEFATYPRPGRILAELAPNFPLPTGCQSVNVPLLTTGTSTNWQGNDNSATPGTDITDSYEFSEVVTIAGMADVALQALEMSPAGSGLDFAFFKDLTESYDYSLEQQMLIGPGGSTAQAQLQGILNNVTGAGAVTYTTGSPTASGMFIYIGQTAASIGKNRKKPPEIWMMTTSRWSWLMSSEDTALRPFEEPSLNGPTPACPGSLLGWPVWVNDAIPYTATAGSINAYTGGTQDFIVACRPSDMLVFEADPVRSSFMEVDSGTLQAKLILRNYVAALTVRYPTAVSVLSGTGMAVQSGF